MTTKTSQANRTLSDLQPQNLQLNYATKWYCASGRQFSVATTILIAQKASQIYFKATQIAPEVIFVKPEVKFLPLKIAAMGHLCVFNALKGLLRTQKRQNPSFCA